MEDHYVRNSLRFLFGMGVLVILYSCANIASPNGGPYDEAPPKYVSSTPLPNQLNYKGKKVEIIFDELIQLESPTENVIITPPQAMQPTIQSRGRRVVVEMLDTLRENTTYTIDFASSILDNNESNPLENYTFAFSTGETIDSLEISGIVLNAENLEPISGITVGVHTDLADSAFLKTSFVRTSRTNDRGEFTIRNMAAGTYRLYALEDVMRAYKYNQPGQQIAFYDSLIVPAFELTTREDTLWVDSLTIDTIQTVGYTHFTPDNIEMRLFAEPSERQYMLRPERSNEKILTLRFNAALGSVPQPEPINFTPTEPIWYIPQTAEEGKAVHYWLLDSLVWKQDTLRVAVDYLKSDSLNILQPQRDTVQFIMRRRPSADKEKEKEKKRKKKDDDPEPIEFLGMNVKASGTINYYDTLSVLFDEPVVKLTKEHFRLEQMVDSVWGAVDFDFFPDTTNILNFYLKHSWDYAEEYRLEIDSATIYGIYGRWNNKFSNTFKIKREDEYGHLYINVIGNDSTAAFVELLNTGDAPVRKAKVKDGGVLFMDLNPNKYYARLIMDTNDNGVWDTGNYAEKRQPETVIYYPKVFTIMQNWQVEETWDILATPMKRQKPLEATKNKPKERSVKNRDYKNEGK